MLNSTRLKIGGIVLALNYDSSCRFEVDGAYRDFVVEDAPDVTMQVHYGCLPDLDLGQKVFDSGGAWTLYQNRQRKWGISLRPPVAGTPPYQLAVFEEDFHSGDIYVRTDVWGSRPLPFPLRHPLSQVWMIHLLSRGHGILFHACGVSCNGHGYVFVGVSGAGKSTLANLWKGRRGVTLLSDDRVVVRQKEGRFWAHGTPWHGDAHVASSETVPLDRIFVIRHAAENVVVPLSPPDIVSLLLVRSFSTLWDAPGMAFTLEFLEKLSCAVPCYDLGFVPDSSAVDFVQCLP